MYLALTQVNAWHWWFLSDGIKYGNGTDNAALTDINLNYPKRAYVTGQWSKFVRPGWHRIGVSYSGPLQITAFKSADDNSFAIAVVNPGNTVIRQTYVLDDIQAKFVNPWATSSTLSLAPLRRVSVVGSTFTYEMPAQSVVTFTGTADKLR
jgi:glucuronoarabinoxylan endo-1,4-beta-xylanase